MPYPKGRAAWNRGLPRIFWMTPEAIKNNILSHTGKRPNRLGLKATCTFCGKIFPINGRTRASQKNIFCSRECSAKFRKGKAAPWSKCPHPWTSKLNIERGKFDKINMDKAREIFEDYKKSKLRLALFADKIAKSKYGLALGLLAKIFKKYFPDEYEMFIESKMCKNYLKGRTFEYRVRDFLQQKSYFVTRSPRSKGVADLVAIRKGEILLIQCKVTNHFKSSSEKNELLKVSQEIGATPILAGRSSEWRSPMIFTNIASGEIINFAKP